MIPAELPLPYRDQVIAFDFDGVLATYEKGQYPKLGEPIPVMVKLLCTLLQRYECWVFTSRVHPDNGDHQLQYSEIRAWLQNHVNVNFEHHPIIITDRKCPRIGLFLDDRAVRIAMNRGELDLRFNLHTLEEIKLGEFIENQPSFDATIIPNGTTINDSSPTVPEILRTAAGTYEERNRVYGDSYKLIGHTFASIFPKGLTLKTPEEWNRALLFIHVVNKACRYANNLQSGGHKDSARDASVYSAMLEEVTDEKA